jgi:hypothetical protein
MIKYTGSAITSKMGINYIRSLVEGSGSLFHKIEQENDLGIDALIEFVQNGRPMGAQIAIQVKSGDSYYQANTETCTIPVNGHLDYWNRYPLPVIGVVYIPSLDRAHWVDLKLALSDEPDARVVQFTASEANRLDRDTFWSLFVPIRLRQTPNLSLPKALALAESHRPDEANLGLKVLFQRYRNEQATWEALVNCVVKSPEGRIPRSVIYYLAHIPWHGDIAFSGEPIAPETRTFAANRISRLGRPEIVKLLDMIDRESGVARGTIGQSVEALVSSLPNIDPVLTGIAADDTLSLFVCECAALILAMHIGKAALPTLIRLAARESWFAAELARVVTDFGAISPYA